MKVSLAKKNLHVVDRESLVEKITITKLKSHHTIKTESQNPVVDGAEVEAGIAPSQSQIDEVELGAGAVIIIEPGQANVAEVEAENEIELGEVAAGAKIVKSPGPVNVAEVENDHETVENLIKKVINHKPADEVEAGAKIV